MKLFSPCIRMIAMAAVVVAASISSTSCRHIDSNRLYVGYVNITFLTVGDWNFYGVSGAGQYKRFILKDKIPAGFPYTALSSTGVGGVLLCTTYTAEPVAYDLACPVECRSDVRVFVNEENEAECPRCHSRYYIFESPGHPIAGPAAEEGYSLKVYNVGPGSRGEYMVVSL